MLQILHVDEAEPRAARAYRLQVKERLYRFNFVRRDFTVFALRCGCRFAERWCVACARVCVCVQEVLMQLDKAERQQKLEETFRSVCEDYRRILAMAKI